MKKTQKTEQYAIIANRHYGLYAGVVVRKTPQPDGTLHVEVRECRHVARWFGKTGGITSLAAYGLCGPRATESRIGAPCTDVATLTGIVNIFPMSTEARKTIEAAVQS